MPGPGVRLLATAPWRRAPRLLARHPGLAGGVTAVALVLGLAAAAGPIFLSSSSNALIAEDLDEGCASTVGLRVSAPGMFGAETPIGQPGRPFVVAPLEQRDAALRESLAGVRDLGEIDLMVRGSAVTARAPAGEARVRLMYRTGLDRHVEVVSQAPTGPDGVWIPQIVAERLDVGPGDTIEVASFDEETKTGVPVAAVYRDLGLPLPPAWCADQGTVFPVGTTEGPDLLVFADRPLFIDLGRSFDADRPIARWQVPADRGDLTLPEATRLSAELAQRATDLRGETPLRQVVQSQTVQLYLPDFVVVWQGTRAAVRQGVVPVAAAALVVSALFVVAVMRLWGEQRGAELDLLIARGVGPLAIGAKAVLEIFLPVAVGVVGGWLLAMVAVRALGPGSLLDSQSVGRALGASLLAGAAGTALAGAVVATRVRLRDERRATAPRSSGRLGAGSLATLLVEILLLVAAVVVYRRVTEDDEELLRQVSGAPRVDMLHVVFPLLLVAGTAALVVRLVLMALPAVRRRSAQWPTPLFMAVRRLDAGRGTVHVVTVAAAIAAGLFAFSSIVVASAGATLHGKAALFVGSDVAVVTSHRVELPDSLDGRSTVVGRYQLATTEAGDEVELLAVDRLTFPEGAWWDETLADDSLDDLLAAIGARPDSTAVPVVVAGNHSGEGPSGPLSGGEGGELIRVGQGARATEVPIQVVGRARSFPGQRGDDVMVVADAAAIEALVEPSWAEVWAEAGSDEVAEAVRGAGAPVWRDVRAEQILTVGTFRTTSWIFGFLRALGGLIGALTVAAVVGLIAARERRGRLGYALARRFGLSPGQHVASLLLELALVLVVGFAVGTATGWIASAAIHQHLDALGRFAPAPLFRVPAAMLGAAGVVVAAVAAAGCWAAQKVGARARVAEVLRAEG